MSQRFQDLQNPWEEHQDPPRPSAGLGLPAKQWDFDLDGEPSLGEGSLNCCTGGKAKFHPQIPRSCCWAGHEPKFALLSPWDFHRERKEGSKQSRAPGISHHFTFPHLIHQISGFCPEKPGILREGEHSHFSELFLQVWDWGWATDPAEPQPSLQVLTPGKPNSPI